MRRALLTNFGPCVVIGLALGLVGCGRSALVDADQLPLRRVVVYRNGVAYFERSGHVDEDEVRFKMRQTEVGDFLATLAVMETGGSSVRAAAFPIKVVDDDEEPKPRSQMTADEKRGLEKVVLTLDGKEHDLNIGYVAESPVWRPSYRLVVGMGAEADLQAWGIVENLSGEDWKNVRLSLVAGAPLAFEAQLATPVIPDRPVVTDSGEVIAAVPHSETSLREEQQQEGRRPSPSVPATGAAPEDVDRDEDAPAKEERWAGGPRGGGGASPVGKTKGADARTRGPTHATSTSAPAAAAVAQAPPPPPEPPRLQISAPRNLRSLAAVAVEGGATRFDLPYPVTIPDKSATMVMLMSRRVPGEASFLFAPDPGVPDSASHPFRVARFANKTGGVLERGPIAVFEKGAFLGQGMVDPLPDGATATVPFALERAIGIERDTRYDEIGERIAKIQNMELTIERDSVTKTRYRFKNGGDTPAKVLVKHPRTAGARLFQPPPGTEDNTGTLSALVPIQVPVHGSAELTVDERTNVRRGEDWFSLVADSAVKGYIADPRANRDIAAKLSAAWVTRNEIVKRIESRSKLAEEQSSLQNQTEETRRNLRAIEKNKSAEALRQKLTQRLGENAQRLDQITSQVVEIDAKLAELRIQFRELLRDIKIDDPLPAKP